MLNKLVADLLNVPNIMTFCAGVLIGALIGAFLLSTSVISHLRLLRVTPEVYAPLTEESQREQLYQLKTRSLILLIGGVLFFFICAAIGAVVVLLTDQHPNRPLVLGGAFAVGTILSFAVCIAVGAGYYIGRERILRRGVLVSTGVGREGDDVTEPRRE